MNDNVFGPRDHRELAPRLGLQDAGAWTSAGRELLERLRASLERLFPAGSWSEQAPLETPWGLVEAGPALHGCATLAQLSGVAQRLARGLGLRPGRLEHPLELRLAETRFSPAPQVRADLRWQALDRWGTPVALLAAEPTNDSEWLDPASYPHVALSFRTATTPTLLARLLEQGPWPIWLAPESVRVLRLPGDQGALLSDLRAAGLRAGEDAGQGPFAGRVRRAIEERVPVVAVAGPRELAAGQVTLRCADGLVTLPRAEALAWLVAAARPLAAQLPLTQPPLTQRAPEWSAPNSGPPWQAHFSTSAGGNSHSAP